MLDLSGNSHEEKLQEPIWMFPLIEEPAVPFGGSISFREPQCSKKDFKWQSAAQD